MEDGIKSVVDRLNQTQSSYDWFNKTDSSDEIKKITRSWDQLQISFQCCGLEKSEEWIPFRPQTDDPGYIYPTSCCFQPDNKDHLSFCQLEQVWVQGCADQIHSVSSVVFLIPALVVMNMILSVMAGIVICCKPSETYITIY